MRVLLITIPEVAAAVKSQLTSDDLKVDAVPDLKKAELKLQKHDYDAVVLDRARLKETNNGTSAHWRPHGMKTHFLVLLKKGSNASDRAACLESGADACLVHPVSVEELRATVQALKRQRQTPPPRFRRIHDVEIDLSARTATRAGQRLRLTEREFDLLNLLSAHPGEVLSRADILAHLFDGDPDDYSNVVDVYISYLRNKLDRGFATSLILTRWKQGYVFRKEPDGDGCLS